MKKIYRISICALILTMMLQITGSTTSTTTDKTEVLPETCSIFNKQPLEKITDNTPQITDDENDVFGPLVIFPNLIKILNAFRILKIESLDFLDIESAWFYENPDESDYLSATINLKDLKFNNQRTIYSMRWTYNEKVYAVGVHTVSNGEIALFGITTEQGTFGIDGAFDVENNRVTFQMPKSDIGHPKPGDVLTESSAWAGLRFSKETFLTVVFIGELAKDWAGYGTQYIIKY